MHTGTLRINCRAAVADYSIRQWVVDCSIGRLLEDGHSQLCLVYPELLEGVDSAIFAPGYLTNLKSRD